MHGSKSIVLVVEVPVYTHDRIEACMAAEQGSYYCIGGCGAASQKQVFACLQEMLQNSSQNSSQKPKASLLRILATSCLRSRPTHPLTLFSVSEHIQSKRPF